jgi:hypothetical protein
MSLNISIKRVLVLFLYVLVLAGVMPNIVIANEHDTGLASAFETIRELFGFLPELITHEKLISGDPAAIFWARFLIWLLLFAVVYFGATFVFKDNKNIAIVVGIIIAIMGALLIPGPFIVAIFQTYGVVAAVIVWLVPVVAGLFVAHQFPNKLIKAMIYGFAAGILVFMDRMFAVNPEASVVGFAYLGIFTAILVILFLVNLIQGFAEAFGGGSSNTGGGGLFGGLGNIFKGAGDEANSGAKGLFGGTRDDTQAHISEDERRTREFTKGEQNALDKLIKRDVTNIKNNDHLKNYFGQIRNFLHSHDFLLRKVEMNQKIHQLIIQLQQGENINKKVIQFFEKNKNHLHYLKKTLTDLEAYTHEAVKDSIKSKFRRLSSQYSEMLMRETKEVRIAQIEEFLNNKIIKIEHERQGHFKDIETNLNNFLSELRKPNPNLQQLDNHLEETVKELDEIIKLDEQILKLEKEIYQDNMLIEKINEMEVPGQGGTMPRP